MKELEPNHKNYYTGEMNAYHEGPHCGGCLGEQSLDYTGGGNYCCCYEGLTPLEQWTYDPEYPPVDGTIPSAFYYFGTRTQQRWIERFKTELLPEELEKYHQWK